MLSLPAGNLRAAVRTAPAEYELILEPDTNTLGHTQWFFFRVQGMVPGIEYRFHVVNLEKPASLFNQGMRPLVYLHSAPGSPFGGRSIIAPARTTSFGAAATAKTQPQCEVCAVLLSLYDWCFYDTGHTLGFVWQRNMFFTGIGIVWASHHTVVGLLRQISGSICVCGFNHHVI